MDAAVPTTELTDAFAEYLSRVRLYATRTVANYDRVARTLAAHLGSDRAFVAADTAALRGFLSLGGSDNVAAARATWNTKRSALCALYGFVRMNGWRTDDPTSALERQKVPFREASVLSLEEMVRLVDTVERESTPAYRSRNVALVQVFIHTALRLSEVTNLTVGQVDTQAHVFRSVRRKGSKVFDAVFNDVVAEALERFLEDRPRLIRNRDPQALFLSDRGLALSKRTLQLMVARYARLAGISRPVSPHALRHGAATALASLNVPITTIQQVCGHASVSTTQRYIHMVGRERHDAIDKLGRAFRSERSRAAGIPPP